MVRFCSQSEMRTLESKPSPAGSSWCSKENSRGCVFAAAALFETLTIAMLRFEKIAAGTRSTVLGGRRAAKSPISRQSQIKLCSKPVHKHLTIVLYICTCWLPAMACALHVCGWQPLQYMEL
jgi:hypothetical protein